VPERRKLRRRYLIYYLRVFDRTDQQLVGHLVDITTEGMMLLSEEPIETDRIFRFRMVLPKEIQSSAQITFDAFGVWCKKDVNPDFYATGFKFKEITSRDIEVIEGLIDDFGFRE
jgi:hypothetical protein